MSAAHDVARGYSPRKGARSSRVHESMYFRQAKHYRQASRTRRDISLVVIHDEEYPERATSAEWCVDFFTNPQGPNGPVVASAHYAVDSDSVAQSVLENDVAYHAGPVNEYSIGIEHAGYASQSASEWRDEYSTAMLERSAELVADICRRYDIPAERLTAADLKGGKRRGITGHLDVTNGLQGGKGHQDPGPNFPWDWYIERIRAHLTPPQDDSAGLREPSVVTVETAKAGVTAIDFSRFVPISHGGIEWLVSSIYIAPVGISQAAELAAEAGCELPSPGLVDAIWRAADLRVPPHLMVRTEHDGTIASMNSPEIHAMEAAALEGFIGPRSLGRDFILLAGAFKDIVIHDGKVGLYGWHVDETDASQLAALAKLGLKTSATVTPGPGRVVQPFFAGHVPSWIDYSQGVRLCRRA